MFLSAPFLSLSSFRLDESHVSYSLYNYSSSGQFFYLIRLHKLYLLLGVLRSIIIVEIVFKNACFIIPSQDISFSVYITIL